MNYEDRIVLYIDILGFKDLLDETVDKDGNDYEFAIDKIVGAYNSIRDVWDLDSKDNDSSDEINNLTKKISIFSDCIVISFLAKEESEIFHTLLEVKWMIIRLIYKGILCRGAITYGKLVHNDRFLFGPALVEAYLLESKAANYPRVILDRNIIDLAGRSHKEGHSSDQEIQYVESLLEKDLDGMYYIDYFAKAQEELDDPDYDFPIYIQKLADKIRHGMNRSKNPNKADIRVKYIWMKEKYNLMVEMGTRKEFLKSLKNYGDSQLFEFYKNLKKINPTVDIWYKKMSVRKATKGL